MIYGESDPGPLRPEDIQIRHMSPQFRLMLRELLLPGVAILFGAPLVFCLWAIHHWWGSYQLASDEAGRFAIAAACLNATAAWFFAGLLAWIFLGPVMARLVLPMLILLLEVLRSILYGLQWVIDKIGIELLMSNALYPKDRDR